MIGEFQNGARMVTVAKWKDGAIAEEYICAGASTAPTLPSPITYSNASAPVTATVPAGVCAVTFDAIGGQGGGTGGAAGGEVKAIMTMSAGESYTVAIGGAGGPATGGLSGGASSGGAGGTGGSGQMGGGGGGATVITVGGASSPTIVASGGGGSGLGDPISGGSLVTAGGAGGASGANGVPGPAALGTGGKGATTTAAGAGGAGALILVCPGWAWSEGLG